MATPANDLETALASAGLAPEAAQRLGEALQQLMEEALARQAPPQVEALASPIAEATSERVIHIEQAVIDLREILTVRFDAIDRRFEESDRRFELTERRFDEIDRRLDLVERKFEEIDRRFDLVDRKFELMERKFQEIDHRFELVDLRFAEIDRRFVELNDRLNRERRERLGFVTAATGAIVAGLLRIFGAI